MQRKTNLREPHGSFTQAWLEKAVHLEDGSIALSKMMKPTAGAPTHRTLDHHRPPTTITAAASCSITTDLLRRLPRNAFIHRVVLLPPPTLDIGERLRTSRLRFEEVKLYDPLYEEEGRRVEPYWALHRKGGGDLKEESIRASPYKRKREKERKSGDSNKRESMRRERESTMKLASKKTKGKREMTVLRPREQRRRRRGLVELDDAFQRDAFVSDKNCVVTLVGERWPPAGGSRLAVVSESEMVLRVEFEARSGGERTDEFERTVERSSACAGSAGGESPGGQTAVGSLADEKQGVHDL
ncbi:hypothetical protein M5K25_004526 [Dendrobium thyrsiflorum]|uniref:Uncharacterized protein n=1 Tax=Dendrobium thyrsiflorum TaxID=117978 RepID=A0ABD0VLW1_DENTH